MDRSSSVILNIPTCTVNYKLYLDDLDLALLPISRLMGKYTQGPSSPSSSQLDGERDDALDGPSEDDHPVVCLNGISDCTAAVEFKATAEKREKDCANDEELNKAQEERQTQFCHICNIAVPKKYAKEHNKSKLHITLLQLANEAVSRLNKHIQQQLSEAEDACYCAPCNQEVKSLDDHERQVKHKLLKKREELLVNLLELYTDENADLNEHTRQIIDDMQSRLPETAYKKEVLAAANSIPAAEIKGEDPRKCLPEYSHMTKESLAGLMKNTVKNDSAAIANNAAKTKLEASPQASGSQPQGGASLVPYKPKQEEIFINGSDKLTQISKCIKANYYFCKICAVNVPNNTINIIGHNNCPAHRTKLEKLHAAEKKALSKDADKRDDYLCNICAVKIPNTTLHIIEHDNSEAHKIKLEQLLVVEKKSLSKEPDFIGYYYCNICAVKVPNITTNITEHDNGSAHKAKLEEIGSGSKSSTTNELQVCSSLTTHKPTQQWPAGSSILLHFTEATKDAISTGHYFCNICAVKVPNITTNITEHDNGAAHKAKLEEIRSGRKSSTTNEPQVCSSLTPHKPTHQWLAGSSILPHLTQAAKDAISTGHYFCNVCAVKVPNNTNNITGHNNGAAHKAKLGKLQAAGKVRDKRNESLVSSSVASDKKTHQSQPSGFITCENMQNFTIANLRATTNNYANKGLAKVNDYCTVCGVITGIGNFEQHLISRSHKEHFQRGNLTDETVGYNLCQLCNFKMPNHYKVINEHYTGQSHASNFDNYLAKNKIDVLGGNQIRCIVCLKSMHLSFVWGHVKNEEHLANLNKYLRRS